MREIDAALSDLRRWLVNVSEDSEHLARLSGDDASERGAGTALFYRAA